VNQQRIDALHELSRELRDTSEEAIIRAEVLRTQGQAARALAQQLHETRYSHPDGQQQ
jgi:hypothetical protein